MTDLALKVRLTGDGRQLEGTLRGTKRDLDGLGGSARKAGQAAGTAGGQVRQFGTHVGATRGAVGQLSSATGAARQNLGQFTSTTQSASAGLVGLVSRTGLLVAGIAGVGLGLKSAVSSFVSYDSTMRRVGAISGATEAQMGRMRDMAQELGATTRFSTGQAAEGFQFLSMAGLDAEQSMAALPGVLQLAAAGALDLGTAANISTNILSGYGLEIAELGRVNDVLAKASTSSNTTVQQLGTAFVTAGSVAAAAGQEFEVTTGILALMANAGAAGERSGTALRGALARLLDPTAEVADTLARLGVEINDSSGQMRSLDDLMIELAGSGMSAGDAIKIFGQEAGPVMLAAIGQGEDAITGMVEKMRNAEGTAETVAGALKGSLGGALTELGSAAEGAGIALVDLVQGALRRVLEGITAFVSAVTSRIRAITPAWTEVFGRITNNMGTVMTVLVGMVGSMVTGMTGEFQLIDASWLAVLASMPRALEATVQTVTLQAVKLTLQVANALEELKPRSAQVWNSIKATTLSIMATIEEAVVNAYRGILSAIGGLVADAGVQLIGLARTTATVSETMARKVEDAAISMQKLGRDMQTTGQHSSSLRDRIGELDAENAALSEGMRGVNQSYRTQIDTIDEMIAEYWAEVDAIQRSVDGRDEVVEAIDRESGARQTIEQQMTTAIEQLDTSTEASKGAKGATDQLRESLEETGPAAQQAAAEQAEAAKESERAWKQLGDSIQSNLSNAFVNLVDKGLSSFSDLVDTIKNWFVKLLADMAAAAAARPIMLAIGASGMGGMINPALAGAPGGGLGGIGGIGNALSGGLGSVFGGLTMSAGAGLVGAGAGTFGSGMLATGGLIANQGLLGGGLAALGNAGGLAATGNLMAAAGAALPILLPIAGAILAFGGLLGSSTPPRAYVVGDAASGDLLQQVEKKGQDATALIKMLDSIVASTSATLAGLGGTLSAGAAQFDLHINPDRLRLTFVPGSGWEDRLALDVDPEDSAAVADAVAKMMLAAVTEADFSEAAAPVGAFFETLGLDMIAALPQGAAEQIIGQFQGIGEAATAAAEQFPWLADAIRDTATTTDAGAQELAAYTVALIAVGQALSTDPVDLYRQAVEAQSTTLIERLAAQGEQVQQLAAQYDGSAQSAEALAGGVLQLQQSAVQALAQIDAARQSVTDSVTSTRQQIELSLMSQAEKVGFWLGEAERLREELSAATDPAAIDQLAKDTTAALLSAWQNMDEDRRGSEADFIRGFLDSIDATAAQGLDDAAGSVHQIWTDAAQTVESTLSGAAAALSDAASAIRAAGQQLSAAIPSSIHVTSSVTITGGAHDQPGGGRARGGIVRAASGWIGAAGAVGGDTIPILVGAGEAVLNRHQQRVVNGALHGQYGIDLDGLFARESRPHTAPPTVRRAVGPAPSAAYQRGGIVQPQPAHDPELAAAINRLADAVAAGRAGSQELAAAARDLPRRIVVELPRNELTVR